MCRTAVRDRTPLLVLLLTLCFAAGPAVAAQNTAPALPVGPEIVLPDDGGGYAVDLFADGRYVVVSRVTGSLDLQARLFAPDHRPLGEPFVVGPVTRSTRSFFSGWDLVVTDDLDGWALAWTQVSCTTCPTAVYLSLYDGEQAVVEAVEVSSGATDHYGPVLAADGGRVAVGWTVDNAVEIPFDGENFSDAFGRLFDLAGQPLTNPFQIHVGTREEQVLDDAAWLPGGDLVFVWESYEGEGEFYDVFRRHFDRDGLPLEGNVRVHLEDDVRQYRATIGATAFGYVVAWVDWLYTPDFNGTIAIRAFDRDGTPLGPDFPVSEIEPKGDRYGASVAGAADGGFLVTWGANCSVFAGCSETPHGPDGSFGGVFARSFAPAWATGDETAMSDEIQVPPDPEGGQGSPSVHATSANGYAVFYGSRGDFVVRHFENVTCFGLCLGGGQFEAQVHWRDFQGGSGDGTPTLRGDDWGTFWFFDPDNPELALKVIDGRALTGHYWAFSASLTNVAYTLTVVDKESGLRRSYLNPAGNFASRGDTTALPAAPPPAASRAVPPFLAAASEGIVAACDAGEVCVQEDRFAIEIEWEDFVANQGDGVGQPLTADAAWFWFFRPGNPEVLVKVLDGRPINGRWWVFYAALTNVGFTLRVTDRMTNETVTYENPLGNFASRGDTTAFDG